MLDNLQKYSLTVIANDKMDKYLCNKGIDVSRSFNINLTITSPALLRKNIICIFPAIGAILKSENTV